MIPKIKTKKKQIKRTKVAIFVDYLTRLLDATFLS